MKALSEACLERLTTFDAEEYQYLPLHRTPSPSIPAVREIMGLLRMVIFPGFFEPQQEMQQEVVRRIGMYLKQLYDLLCDQIYNSLCFESEACKVTREQAAGIALSFIRRIPDIKHFLSTDVKAILDGDPAATSLNEVIFCYPATQAMFHQRAAHELFKLKVPILPRFITEMAHSETGIDIHPGARIGRYFSIDHGTGVVIGQTTIIGNHVRLYQGVTLGAKRFMFDDKGLPVDIPRHPIIEDNVTIYSNTSVLGRITIGEGSVIGGNIWLTHSVPPNSQILQPLAIEEQ